MKKIVIIALSLCMLLTAMPFAYANEAPEHIPNSFTPGTIIEYQEDGSWRAITYRDTDYQYSVEQESRETVKTDEPISLEEEERIVSAIEQEAERYPHYTATYPAPTRGMRVAYDNWGEIESVYIPETDGTYRTIEPEFVRTDGAKDVSVPQLRLSQGTRKPAGTYTYGSVVSNSVGYTTNTIKITLGSVLGTGDFTCFTDIIGDHDNYLQYGDCATKNSIDNPWYGTVIYARNMTNNVGTSFIKNDNGGLPNAVLDIWKTGLTKLGVTSTNYGNIKFAGRYYYTF